PKTGQGAHANPFIETVFPNGLFQQDIKDLLLTCWCQTPQHTFRGLLGSMDLVVRAVFV
ncbi:Neuropeptide Y receptor type 4, partial [Dissostichus eleginoides]